VLCDAIQPTAGAWASSIANISAATPASTPPGKSSRYSKAATQTDTPYRTPLLRCIAQVALGQT
jgi:hypothetical protein